MSVGIQDMPILILEMIGLNLSASDLNNCCAVNRAWHAMFGRDLFWKKHCNMELIAYLKATPCEVNDIKAVVALDPHIRQMGEYRANYVMVNQLRKNWINGRCKSNIFWWPSIVNAKIYENDYLIIVMTTSVEIYNIAGGELNFIRMVSYDLPLPFDFINSLFFHDITNDKFVISQNNLVKVFDISMTEEWEVSFSFLFNLTEEQSLAATQNPDISDFMDYNIVPQTCMEIITGDFYVAVVRLRELLENCNILMHIWNIRTKKKLKVEKIPIENEHLISVFVFNTETPSDTILVECKIRSITDEGPRFKGQYFVYNLSTLMYFPICVLSSDCSYPSNRSAAILHDHLYVLGSTGLTVYNCNEKNQVIGQYPFTGHNCMTLARDYLTSFSFSQERREWKMLEIPSGEIKTLSSGRIVDDCYKVWERVVLCVESSDPNTRYSNTTSLWHLGLTPKMISTWSGKYMSHSRSCTRMLLNNEGRLSLITFW